MIFVDSNIPMYLVGAEHPNKEKARQHVEEAIRDAVHLVSSAEVYQEVLHRYVAIGRREAIGPALVVLEKIVDEVYPIDREDVARAAGLLHEQRKLSARDAIHLAVMRRHGVRRIMSFDRGFDEVAGVERLG